MDLLLLILVTKNFGIIMAQLLNLHLGILATAKKQLLFHLKSFQLLLSKQGSNKSCFWLYLSAHFSLNPSVSLFSFFVIVNSKYLKLYSRRKAPANSRSLPLSSALGSLIRMFIFIFFINKLLTVQYSSSMQVNQKGNAFKFKNNTLLKEHWQKWGKKQNQEN